MKIIATLESLNKDYSGTEDSRRLRALGWERIPVVKFGDTEYAILWNDAPHPGHNTAEVINVSEFDDGLFSIAVTTAQRRNHTQDGPGYKLEKGCPCSLSTKAP